MNLKYLRRFDWLLLLAMLALAVFGIWMIRGVELNSFDEQRVVRQTRYLIAGLAGFIVLSIIDYRVWGRISRLVYAALLGSLALVAVIGGTFGGARSSFELGSFNVQPAEYAKVLLVVVLAKYMADHDMRDFRHVLVTLGITLIPMAMIAVQPDLGGALLLGPIWFVMAFMAGMRVWHMGSLGLVGAAAVPLSLRFLEGYQLSRIVNFLDPTADASGGGYNTIQALIAIGSGGWWGQGYGRGLQSQLHYLRQRYTDYIFSVMAEELGWIGIFAFFTVIIFLIFRILRASKLSNDMYGTLLCVGVGATLFIQTALNVSVNLNLLPTTGQTLPFISYGGSSLLTFMFSLGLVESVLVRRKTLKFDW
jgi:rod shape determining protein RodA